MIFYPIALTFPTLNEDQENNPTLTPLLTNPRDAQRAPRRGARRALHDDEAVPAGRLRRGAARQAGGERGARGGEEAAVEAGGAGVGRGMGGDVSHLWERVRALPGAVRGVLGSAGFLHVDVRLHLY